MPTETRDDMVERAAKAIEAEQEHAKQFAAGDDKLAYVCAVPEHAARAALSAALDPEDEKIEVELIEVLASLERESYAAQARGVVAHLRALALGGGNG